MLVMIFDSVDSSWYFYYRFLSFYSLIQEKEIFAFHLTFLFSDIRIFLPIWIWNSGVSPNAIVVQSPYVAQVQLLRDMLDGVPEAAGTEVSTIDSFQGREADAVILSMVWSESKLYNHGFNKFFTRWKK